MADLQSLRRDVAQARRTNSFQDLSVQASSWKTFLISQSKNADNDSRSVALEVVNILMSGLQGYESSTIFPFLADCLTVCESSFPLSFYV